jgi:hypothetical protein
MSEDKRAWRFEQPRNTAVIVSRSVVEGRSWVASVSHDANDGGWQFVAADHSGDVAGAGVVSLEEVVRLDPSVESLCDLPEGWSATRASRDAEWVRRSTHSIQKRD